MLGYPLLKVFMANFKSGVAPFISQSDFSRAMNACTGFNQLRNQTVLLVSHKMGLRAKEIACLKFSDFFDTDQDGQLRDVVRLLAPYTKGHKYRELPIVHPLLRKTLMDYHVERQTRSWGTHPTAALFISQKGGHFTPNTIQRMIWHLYRNVGIVASSHSGRRSFATNFLQSGGNIYDLMVLMGHANISTTQIYQTTSIERLRSELARMP